MKKNILLLMALCLLLSSTSLFAQSNAPMSQNFVAKDKDKKDKDDKDKDKDKDKHKKKHKDKDHDKDKDKDKDKH